MPENKELIEVKRKIPVVLLLLFLVIAASTVYVLQKSCDTENALSDHISESLFLPAFHLDNEKYLISCNGNQITVYLENGAVLFQTDLKDEIILSSSIADLDKDGSDEIILLVSKGAGNTVGEGGSVTSEDSSAVAGGAGPASDDTVRYGEDLVVLSVEKNSDKSNETVSAGNNLILKEIYAYNCKVLNPWKVQTSDVDGDGMTEIALAVYKTSPFHPVMAKRPFLYDWINGGIFPKWRGSRLSRPFDDYVFADMDSDGKDELVSAEHLADGGKVLSCYCWKGFGFEKIAESEGFEDISSIRTELYGGERTNAVHADVMIDSKWEDKTFYFFEGTLLTRKESMN
jgi:hypothetical protein